MIKGYKKGSEIQITQNFYSHEFDCKCDYPECRITFIDLDHVKRLQEKRSTWNKTISILSGYRCPRHNKDIKGAKSSRHMLGQATDIIVNGMSPRVVADKCQDFDGVGRYKTFVHLDSRGKRARWGKS